MPDTKPHLADAFFSRSPLSLHLLGLHLRRHPHCRRAPRRARRLRHALSLLSTVLLIILCLGRRIPLRVSRAELWRLALIGILFMSGNNMLLTWGEQMVPSGFASLVVSTMPIMIALMEAVLPNGEALSGVGWAGTITGTGGIAVLVWPSLHHQGGVQYSRPLLGTVVLIGAALAFAVGSVLSRRFRFQSHALVATGWQVAAAGMFNISVAAAGGTLQHAHFTRPALLAIAYLSVFGTLFGLVAFTYLLKNVAVTKVATYAFVNPIIAVILGVALFGEKLARTELLGMAIILAGVATVVLSRTVRPTQVTAAPTEP